MRLLLDEDSQGNLLVRLLRGAGHDVETVTEAGMVGDADTKVLSYARRTGRVFLTRNVKDFFALHEADRDHCGTLVKHQDADPAKNMSYPQIVAALAKIETSGWHLQGEFVSINPWQ